MDKEDYQKGREILAKWQKDSIPKDPNFIIGFLHEYEEYGCFSNWYKSDFYYAGIQYNCIEQYMMYQKAMLFGDYAIANQIMESNDPQSIKQLGRKVSDFDAELWGSISYHTLKRAIKAKFQQNSEILEVLLSTEDKILVECNPNDMVWGIGMNVNDSNLYKPQMWKGENRLGRILMEVREELKDHCKEYRDVSKLGFIEIWKMPPGLVYCNPVYHQAIKTYLIPLPEQDQKWVLEDCSSFIELEIGIITNMSGFNPYGFFELKQEIYDLNQ